MKNRLLLSFLFALQAGLSLSQIGTVIPSIRRQDWSIAGVNWADMAYTIGDVSAFDRIYNVTSNPIANLDKTGATPCDAGLQAIMNSLTVKGEFVLLYFPEGTYKFNNNIHITRSDIVLRGANPAYTTFLCNNITVSGSPGSTTYNVTGKSTNSISTSVSPSTIGVGDYVEIKKKQNTTYICTPCPTESHAECLLRDWEFGQISKVIAKSGTTLTLEDNLGIDYDLDITDPDYKLRVAKILPVKKVGIEDIKILHNSSGTFVNYTIRLNYTVNCWISGVESNFPKEDHFGITKSAKATVTGSYVHHSQSEDYDEGYGIYIGEKSTNCLVENNIAVHCRHGIILSTSMPHKNVIGYNVSLYSESDGSPQNVVLHGAFVNGTLMEGNVSNYFQSDNYWGFNGYLNTTFRNRFLILENQSSKSGNTYGNMGGISSTTDVVDMLEGFNNTTGTYPDISYYRTARPAFLPARFSWPVIGPPAVTGQPTSGTNPAEERFLSGGQYTVNPRDVYTGYSIENYGLITGLNAITDYPAVVYRNKNDLSIGHTKLFEDLTGYWDAGPITTTITDTMGHEEILTSYYSPSGNSTFIQRTTNKSTPAVVLLTQNNARVTAMVAGDFNGDGIDEYFTAITEFGIPKLYKSNNINNLKQSLFCTFSSGDVISCLAAGDVDGNMGGDAGEELFIGVNFRPAAGNETKIYRCNDGATFAGSVSIYYDTSNYWDIVALACGDFDSDGDEELIEGFNCVAGGAIYKDENGNGSVVNIHSPVSGMGMRALAAGDLDLDGDEELVSGFYSTAYGAMIYKSEDASPAREVLIYSGTGSYWMMSSLAIEKSALRSAAIEPEENGEAVAEAVAKNVLVFPNPSTGSFYLQVLGGLYPDATYKVFNLQGQEITTGTITESVQLVDLNENASGMLLVQVINGPASEFIKVMVER